MDKLKLLIADDEKNIREGLKCILDWESLGYKICGEASNGKDSLQQIFDLNPDLIIHDIKMPGCSGIDVISQTAEHCKKNNLPFPAFIILSGYSDFDYAQKAINNGAKAYLLKPVDEEELLTKVKEITEEILLQKKQQESSKNNELFETKDIISKIFLTNNYENLENINRLKFFENAETSSYQVIICNFEYKKNINLINFENSIDNYFSFFNKVLINQAERYYIILKTSNEMAVKNAVIRTAKLQIEKTFITIGKMGQGLKGLLDSYKNALENEKYLFFFSDIPYVSDEEINTVHKDSNINDFDSIINNLIFCIETYDKNQLEKIKKEIKELTFNIKENETNIKRTFIYCLVELRFRLVSKYPEREISDGNTYDVVKKLMNYNNFTGMFECFCKILDDFIENFNFNTSDSVIVKVLAYIKTNYASDLKLENLGELFNCNSAYLGKKFKKYTGVQFNTYLDNLRMEIAKDKLVNTDLKIYQISKLVGFSNTDYFFMKFKKNTGLTPKDFKKQVEDEKNNN